MPRAPLPFDATSATPQRYAVVIDAGSTGSRVHAFAFTAEGGLVSDTFEQLKPGLSSYAATPAKGADSLRPLLDKAVAAVPEAAQPDTPVVVRATAGLRLLPGKQAEDLLSAVRTLLGEYPFAHDAESVSVLSGADEGAFQWLTLNYLLGNLGAGVKETVAAIDLGGGSVQLAHAVEPAAAKKAPEGYVRSLSGGGVRYDVYVHSYLGYGLMAGRAAVLKAGKLDGHPCVAAKVAYTYGSATVTAQPAATGADAKACAATAVTALDTAASCAPAPAAECGFAGAWGGGGGPGAQKFYVSSYFWDRASSIGVVPDGAIDAVVTPSAFAAAATKACTDSKAFEKAPSSGDDAALFCLDLAYCGALLTTGFGLDGDAKLTLVKQVRYNGAPVEAAWPLGAAVDALG